VRKRIAYLSGLALLVLLAFGVAVGEWSEYKDLFMNGQYQQVVDLCEANKGALADDPGAHIIYKYCGLAKMRLYEQNHQSAELTDAIGYLEKSIAFSYSEEASYNLGLARMKALDALSEADERLEAERDAINDMWESTRNMHAMENFESETLSDGMLIWLRDFRDVLIERVFRDEKEQGRLHLLAAQLRMIADRFGRVDPAKGENEVRQGNLKVFKDWMDELLKQSYFDNNIVVGMYKYQGDRQREKYDQTDKTEDQFAKSLHHYGEALKRVKTNKAGAVLYGDIAYLCSLYNSKDKEKLVSYYKTGFTHAHEGLLIMKRLNRRRQDSTAQEYPFEDDNTELTAKLQKAYGSNLTGLCYFHYLRKDYKSVVSLREYAFDTGFDWDGKVTMLMLIADSADKLASQNHANRLAFNNYREICLFSSSRAFKSVLKNFKGKTPPGSEEFCRIYQNYVNYLRRFGETIEAQSLSLQYEASCAAVAVE